MLGLLVHTPRDLIFGRLRFHMDEDFELVTEESPKVEIVGEECDSCSA